MGRCWFGRCDGIRGWSGFWYTEDLNIIFRRGQAIHYAVRIAVDCCLTEARLIRGRSQTARGYGSWGDKRLSRTAWSKEIDGKELHEATWWRVRSRVERIRFFLHTISSGSQHSPSEHLQMWYYAGFKGVVFFTRSLVLL